MSTPRKKLTPAQTKAMTAIRAHALATGQVCATALPEGGGRWKVWNALIDNGHIECTRALGSCPVTRAALYFDNYSIPS